MAFGRRDYYIGIAPIKSVIGPDQVHYIRTGTWVAAAGTNSTVLTLNIPIGREFYITHIIVSCSHAGINRIALSEGTQNTRPVYFDTTFTFNYGEGNAEPVAGGGTVDIKLWNDDDVEVTFQVTLEGFTENA